MKNKLPPITETAKKIPLGIIPHTGEAIYYSEVEKGEKKLSLPDKLNTDQQITLSMKRYLANEPGIIATLNGQSLTNEMAAAEIKKQSVIGRQLLKMDINYLEYYLSKFPENCFEK